MSFEISYKEGNLLVILARKSVEDYLLYGKKVKPPQNLPLKFEENHGVFVTIKEVSEKGSSLRGCIGFPYPTQSLAESVIEAALESATADPRFPSLSFDELNNVLFEVSVLTTPTLVKVASPKEYPSKINVGSDGLIVELGGSKGLLLPQVAVEWNWDSEEFLCNCCIKAGLSPDSWLLKETRIYKFSSIIVTELETKGKIDIVDFRKLASS